MVLYVSYLTQSYLSGAGRDGNDIKLKQRGRVNYSTARKVTAQYWLKAWDLSTDKEAEEEKTPTSENNKENNPMGFCLSRQ